MPIVETLTELAAPFAHLYNNSKVLSIGTTYLHLASMLGAGGLAIAADRVSLRLPAGDTATIARHITDQASLHRLIVGGLAISVITGVMLFASDVETFAVSLLYWIKIGGVVLLLGNGLLLQRAERRLITDPADVKALGALKGSAWASLFLWFAVALLGTVLVTNA
jgi:hypothetical protein